MNVEHTDDPAIGEKDAALVMHPDGMLRAILPKTEGGFDAELPPHSTMIAGMFLSFRDGTQESKDFMNHCIEYISKLYGNPI